MIIARIEYQPDTLRQLCEQVGTVVEKNWQSPAYAANRSTVENTNVHRPRPGISAAHTPGWSGITPKTVAWANTALNSSSRQCPVMTARAAATTRGTSDSTLPRRTSVDDKSPRSA
jgi:hypothetical protein